MDEPTQEIVVVESTEIDLPRATHSGILKIGNAEINCFVVQPPDEEDPMRLLSGRAVTKAFGLTGRGPGMRRFIEAERIREKMSDRALAAIENPVKFNSKSSGL